MLLTTPSRHGRHSVEARGRLVTWSRSLSSIRRKLGFVKDDDDDLIEVGEDEDEQAWMPCSDVVYRRRRNEQGRLAYRLIEPIMGLDPDECDHDGDGLEDRWYG